MKIVRARRVLRKRLAYLTAKVDAGHTPALEEKRAALDLALRILKWKEDERQPIEALVARASRTVLPIESRLVARARRGDDLLDDVDDLVFALQNATRAA